MILAATLLGSIVAVYVAVATACMFRLRLSVRQGLLYAPFKLFFRIDDKAMRAAIRAEAPLIYTIVHQSRLDPALMLSLLPDDTLHILDEASARTGWLEPWRDLARTMTFNTEHVFVSRRLVRVLKRNGHIAVYLPDRAEPDTRTFRLYRAVSRIALQGGARIVPVFVDGARYAPGSLASAAVAPRRLFQRLRITTLPPLSIQELVALSGPGTINGSNALFDRIAETRLAASLRGQTLFEAVREAGDRFGTERAIVEDTFSGTMSYRQLLMAARVFAGRITRVTAPGEAVGLLLPNSNAMAVSLLALQSAGKAAAMLNHTAGPAAVTAAIRTARVRIVLGSKLFVEKAGIADIVEAVEAGGARFVWMEDLRAGITGFDRAVAFLFWRNAVAPQRAEMPALLMFTSGSEGVPKAVALTPVNLVANAQQVRSRLDVGPGDVLLNVLPMFHCFGLTGGLVLPLLAGVRVLLYPSPLHYKLIPKVAAKSKATVLFATDTFLSAYARAARDTDFSTLRFAVAGAEPLRPETRRLWRERFDVTILEGYGLTEAAPVVALNTATHQREGSVGRLLPGMRARLEPVEGIAEGGELVVSGPNVMSGYMTAESPGHVEAGTDRWHRTGDIVAVDREGFLTIRGRLRRFAKIGGEMVSLAALENLASQGWPDHAHAVAAVPDPRRGERIVLVTTAPDLELAAFIAHARAAGLPEIAYPRVVLQVEAIPLLATGKTDHSAVRKLAESAPDAGSAVAA